MVQNFAISQKLGHLVLFTFSRVNWSFSMKRKLGYWHYSCHYIWQLPQNDWNLNNSRKAIHTWNDTLKVTNLPLNPIISQCCMISHRAILGDHSILQIPLSCQTRNTHIHSKFRTLISLHHFQLGAVWGGALTIFTLASSKWFRLWFFLSLWWKATVVSTFFGRKEEVEEKSKFCAISYIAQFKGKINSFEMSFHVATFLW